MAPSPPLNVRIGVPSLTLSPTLTRIFSTVPEDGAGTSMVALSDSSVSSGSSALIASPSLTRISMIGTSLKSPMSGTVTWVVPAARASVMAVIIVSFPVSSLRAQSNRHRIGFLAIDPVFQDRLGHHLGLDGAFLGQRLERRHRDPVPVHLEEVAQLPAVVRPAVAVGAEHLVAPRHPGPDLVGEQSHVVGRRDHRPAPAGQAGLDMAPAWLLGRVQQVPALGVDGVTAQ